MMEIVLHNLSVINETSKNVREAKRKLNIVFLNVPYVFFNPSRPVGDDKKKLVAQVPREMFETFKKEEIARVIDFSQEAVKNLCQLCEESHAVIVISTDCVGESRSAQIKYLFSICDFGKYIIDSIPSINAKDIEDWLIKHSSEVNSFVVLSANIPNSHGHFDERFVNCGKLFATELLLDKAKTILAKPLQFETSAAKLLFDAVSNNSSQVTRVDFNEVNMSTLKIGFGWDDEKLIERLFAALGQNQFITHLTLRDFYNHVFCTDKSEQLSEEILDLIGEILQKSPMKLQYLNIAHNSFRDLNWLLTILDGEKLHISHLCFNSNPLDFENQKTLAAWMRAYPRLLRIELDLVGASGRYLLDGSIINAALHNRNIYLYTREDLLVDSNDLSDNTRTPIDRNKVNALIAADRLQFALKADNACRIQ